MKFKETESMRRSTAVITAMAIAVLFFFSLAFSIVFIPEDKWWILGMAIPVSWFAYRVYRIFQLARETRNIAKKILQILEPTPDPAPPPPEK